MKHSENIKKGKNLQTRCLSGLDYPPMHTCIWTRSWPGTV